MCSAATIYTLTKIGMSNDRTLESVLVNEEKEICLILGVR
ncbi:hypothetical protein JCM19239_9 [Vibrio variabilis]|uniref:Uncharacterized protein n=1 Tax=Vibrio variabilis TaxID=990271 RepID=A0ABQ0JDE1_9VIBR|nr:hypothetical protein JCM19239_9 [Vibrio variabilis]